MNSELLKKKFKEYGITCPRFVRINKESFINQTDDVITIGGFHNGIEYKVIKGSDNKIIFFIKNDDLYVMAHECEIGKKNL